MLRSLWCLLLLAAAQGELLEQHSFWSPFKEFDAFGRRHIPYWETGGHAFPNKHFVRLTADRQSKRGYMWNNQPLAAKDWSATLEFRVSGQGKNLFGDGFALWLTRSPRFVEGQFFGVNDMYQGMAIVFDTFRNTEAAHVHKDVYVVFNDGSKHVLDSTEARPGCMARYRYHEGRDDFDATRKSLARVTLKGGKLTVKVSERADGQWKDCFTVDSVPVAAKVFEGAFFGLSASTGQLADNHDVIAMEVHSLEGGEEEAPPMRKHEEEDARPVVASDATDLPEMVRGFARSEMKKMHKELEDIQHDLEHKMTAVEDHTQTTVGKLQRQEQLMESRLRELEARVHDAVETRLDALEAALGTRIESSGGSWVLPFVVFALIVGVLVFFAYRKYVHLTKMHLL